MYYLFVLLVMEFWIGQSIDEAIGVETIFYVVMVMLMCMISGEVQ